MRWAQITDTGLVRPLNEDSLCVSPEIGLFAVADGMGGHRAGEVASSAALEILERDFERRLKKGERPESAIIEAIKEANTAIFKLSGQNPDYAGMGTTLTACVNDGNEIFVAQVGDSRAYLLRGEEIIRLTEDHSLVQELVRNGGITEEQAFVHPQRNVLTRALGTESSLEADLYRVKVNQGDLILLCTDGLTGYLRPEDILATVRQAAGIDAAVKSLLEKALQAGGADNVTVILVEI